MLVDTHCHIHEPNYPLAFADVMGRARAAGVERMICVGVSQQSSRDAVSFVADKDDLYAAIGVHPHEARDGWAAIGELLQKNAIKSQKIVAIGEIGLDYYYSHSPRETQITALEAQLQLAKDNNLPVIFHVREAFDDFWPVFDNFSGIRGELHSFTDSSRNLEEGLKRGLFVGINGISTFTKDVAQREMFTALGLQHMLLETDAPFLTPAPFRGTINEPAYVRNIAQFHADARGTSLHEVAQSTTQNARSLFAII